MTDSHLSLLRSYVRQNVITTQQEIVEYLQQTMGLSLSQPTICRVLKRAGITRKKLTYGYYESDPQQVKRFVRVTQVRLAKTPFLAVDESSFYIFENPRYGYSLKGTRACAKKSGVKGFKCTFLLCIANTKENSIVNCQLISGEANTKIFYDFLEEIEPLPEKHYLLLDNASIHRAVIKRTQLGLPTLEQQLAQKNIVPLFCLLIHPN